MSNFLGLNINNLHFTRKSESKKVTKNQRLKCVIGGHRSELSNFLETDIVNIESVNQTS